MKDYIKRKTIEINDKRTAEEKFNDSLDDTPPTETLSEEEDKVRCKKAIINNKKKGE